MYIVKALKLFVICFKQRNVEIMKSRQNFLFKNNIFVNINKISIWVMMEYFSHYFVAWTRFFFFFLRFQKVYVIHWVRVDRFKSAEEAYKDGVECLDHLLSKVQDIATWVSLIEILYKRWNFFYLIISEMNVLHGKYGEFISTSGKTTMFHVTCNSKQLRWSHYMRCCMNHDLISAFMSHRFIFAKI